MNRKNFFISLIAAGGPMLILPEASGNMPWYVLCTLESILGLCIGAACAFRLHQLGDKPAFGLAPAGYYGLLPWVLDSRAQELLGVSGGPGMWGYLTLLLVPITVYAVVKCLLPDAPEGKSGPGPRDGMWIFFTIVFVYLIIMDAINLFPAS